MLNSDIYRMSVILGRDRPEVARLIRRLQNDPKSEPRVRQRLRRMCRERGIDPDNLPEFGLPDEVDAGMLVLGRAKLGDRLCQTAGLAREDLSAHVGIFGQVRIGKSFLVKYLIVQAIRQGVPCFILDVHGEWRDVLAMFEPSRVLWLEPSSLGLNLLEVPRTPDGNYAMRPEDWVAKLKWILRGSLYIRDLSSNVLGDQILKLYRKHGVMDGGDDFPCLSDLYEAIAAVEFRKGNRRWGSKDTLVDRLGMVLQHLDSAVDVARSRDIHKLMNQSVILDFSTIDEVPRTFLFDYLVVLLQVAFPQETQCGLRLIVI